MSEMRGGRKEVLVPKIGKLYKFRTDNIHFVQNKYKFYYTGLLMCIQEDLLNDAAFSSLDLELEQRIKSNPIYGFEVYNCLQYYSQLHMFDNEGMNIDGVMYLSLYEINDMIEPANV